MTHKKYPEFNQLNQPALEKEILKKWKTENTFLESIAQRKEERSFVFYEGPPSANGMPGIHHVISRTIKDLFCRYKTQQGFQVKRKAGWDTHGLPIELGVEKMLGITKEDIGKKIFVEEYNQKCKQEVLRYKDVWEELTTQMGYWVDMSKPYITYETPYIETLWWCLKQLHQKKLLYKSVSIQPYSPAAGTGLSSHELNQPGTYKSVKDTSVIAMFRLAKKNIQALNTSTFDAIQKTIDVEIGTTESGPFFLAWTTTPWTLPSNLGLTIGAKIDYALVQTVNPYTGQMQYIVLAEKLLNKYFKSEFQNIELATFKVGDKNLPWRLLTTYNGKELENLYYEQLMPYALPDKNANPFRVLLGDFVTTEDGTGIVHTAPAFGADDYKVGQKNNIGILTLVDREGKFTEAVKDYAGRYVKKYKNESDYVDVNVDLCIDLKKNNRAFKVEKYEHNYPHCWRTDKPILYYPLDAWFIKTTAVKERMVELNKTINWKPASTGTGRFGNWLENMVDWNLSRSRYWGTPLPIWRTKDGSEEKCIGSIAELKQELAQARQWNSEKINAMQQFDDLHKPLVDEIVLQSTKGEPMYREPDLIDVWFDSGAMPYAQWHYPFEHEQQHKNNFPADYVCEGVDQTRGWFFTLHALGVMLFDSVAFKNVVSNGLVLDKHGNKMSKRLGNTIDPFETLNKYGADATRWYLMTNASPWDNLKFDIDGIQEIQRKFFGTLYNTYQFFALYANVDGFSFAEKYVPLQERTEIDQWIISCLHSLIQNVTNCLDNYDATEAFRHVEQFLDEQLSNWYVRLCRRRFWKGEYATDKIIAYQTLYECLETLSQLIAPLAPFFAEWLFDNLNQVTQRHKEKSVHIALFPKANLNAIQPALETKMAVAQNAVSLILSLRKNANIKVRQPLQKILVPIVNLEMQHIFQANEALILSEVNIKQIEYISNTNSIIRKKAKANFIALGKKMGAKMKAVAEVISTLNQEQIQTLEQNNHLTLRIDNEDISIVFTDVDIVGEELPGWTVASKGNMTIALDINISAELIHEGHAREFVNRIQKIRKESNFELTQKIKVIVEKGTKIEPSLLQFKTYICTELLATDLQFAPISKQDETSIDVNETNIAVCVEKIS